MSLVLMVWMLVFHRMMVFLSFRESFLPTILRLLLWISVGFVPLRICPSGFLDFTFETVPLHHHRVFDPDFTSIISGKVFQYQIWDPGIFNFEFEALSRYLCFTPAEDVTVSLEMMISMATEGSNFTALLTCIGDRDKLLRVPGTCRAHGKDFSSQCFVHNPIRRRLDVLPLHHPGFTVIFDESEDEFYFLLHIGIASTLSGWPLDIMDWVLVYLGFKVDCMDSTSERKRLSTPYPIRMDLDKGMKPKLSHTNSFEKRSFNLRSPSGSLRDLGTLRIQERVESKKDTGWSMRRWPDLKSSNWPFTFLVWVLVYLGTQDLSRDVISVFKMSIWKIRQRRLPDDHNESMPKSSIILISTKRQDTTLFSTTSISRFKSKVMPKAFWSLSYKLLANNKYVKEGHNRLFHLLAWQTSERIAWLLSTLLSKLFQFPIFAYNGCIVLVLYFVNSF